MALVTKTLAELSIEEIDAAIEKVRKDERFTDEAIDQLLDQRLERMRDVTRS